MAGATLRLFVAAYPPADAVASLQEALARLDLPPHRPVPAGQVHMTLQFLGETPAARLEEVARSIRRAAAGLEAFELRPLRLVSLPERGPARLVASETDAPPALRELQRRLATRLARRPRGRPGDRFLPHLTLCRFRAPVTLKRLEEPLRAAPFPVREVVLMRSILEAEGARHARVEAVALP